MSLFLNKFTLKYSTKPLHVTGIPLIFLTTKFSGAIRDGINSWSCCLKPSSISDKKSKKKRINMGNHVVAWPNFSLVTFLLVINIPASCPSNVGLVATLRPGCGIRKQAILSKQDLMCFLTCKSSECCLGFVWNRITQRRHVTKSII